MAYSTYQNTNLASVQLSRKNSIAYTGMLRMVHSHWRRKECWNAGQNKHLDALLHELVRRLSIWTTCVFGESSYYVEFVCTKDHCSLSIIQIYVIFYVYITHWEQNYHKIVKRRINCRSKIFRRCLLFFKSIVDVKINKKQVF